MKGGGGRRWRAVWQRRSWGAGESSRQAENDGQRMRNNCCTHSRHPDLLNPAERMQGQASGGSKGKRHGRRWAEDAQARSRARSRARSCGPHVERHRPSVGSAWSETQARDTSQRAATAAGAPNWRFGPHRPRCGRTACGNQLGQSTRLPSARLLLPPWLDNDSSTVERGVQSIIYSSATKEMINPARST